MATAAQPSSGIDVAASSFLASPDKYQAIGDLLNAAADGVNELGKPDVSELLVETYGDQGITGFLQLTGAVSNAGTSDQVEFYEAGRRHKTLAYAGATYGGSDAFVTLDDEAATKGNLQANDVVMDATSGVRFIVQDGDGTLSNGSTAQVVLLKLDGTDAAAGELTTGGGTVFAPLTAP